ncbi:MAG: nucleotide disphospho-sugar-binding domain-containing protein [Bacillota bacterium]
MSTVVFFGYPYPGHIYPTLGLVKELVSRGENIIYYAKSQYKHVIEEAGATFRNYKAGFHYDSSHSSEDEKNRESNFHDNYITGKEKLKKLNEISNKVIAFHENEITAIKPNYIIHDTLCIWGEVIASKLGIPNISSHVDFIYTQEFRDNDIKCLLKHELNITDEKKLLKYHTKFSKFFDSKLDLFSKAKSSDDYGLKLFYSKYLNITYIPKEFQQNAEILDDKLYKFIGYKEYCRKDLTRFPFRKLGEKPAIYITMGSTGLKECIKFYNLCFEAFKDIGVTVIIAACNKSVYYELIKNETPHNFIIKNYVPQLEILKHSGLFISHGGLTSVREALPYKVPLVIIPKHFDQVTVAQQVESFGVGIYVKNESLSVAQLKEIYEKTYCNESIMNNSKRLYALFCEAGGAEKGAEHILELIHSINKGDFIQS